MTLSEDIPPNAIAVIGMGCKFPGANSVEEYWHILDEGRSMRGEPPSGRFPTHEHQRTTEKTTYWANYLDDVSSFDHRFFKKSSREAASMDPQQRLLLEISYQALESSGFFGPREPDPDVGCFIGVCASDYNDNVASHPPNAFSALGTLRAFVPGRVSHFFGLTGPSLALDTACSSSAVAIDAACKAILHGDCKSALAGGVSVFTSPFFYQNLATASFLSPTGASKSFDASADGYCRGEGVGLVVLKRLSQAVADGDTVLGTILATSVRQSSNKVPITVPYSPSQTALFRNLLSTAGITAEDVTYVEAHGTGTPIGDPLEFEAINEVFGKRSKARRPLHFASVKGNIGHTEGASGVAGLIKTILMMQNRAIPRQVHHVTPHPKIIITPGQVSIPTKGTIPWVADTLIACVNNYGAAGSLAAMIVREPISRPRGNQNHQVPRMTLEKYPVIVTGKSFKSLADNCAKLNDYVSPLLHGGDSGASSVLADVSFHLSDKQNRTFPNMLATTVSSLADLNDQLRSIASNPEAAVSHQTNSSPRKVILMFGGQTARFVGLNKHVYESSALLRKYLDECDTVLRGLGHQRGIYPGIFEKRPTDDIVSLQTMQFALQYACAQSWIDCGVKVDCVLGHSFGQLVALTVAGVLSLVDGLKLVYGRAALIRDKWGPERGCMMTLEADHVATMDLIRSVRKMSPSPSSLELACFNGPKSHVLVGTRAEIERALKSTTAKAMVLDVTHGFHSIFCNGILPDLEELARGLTFNTPKIPVETCSHRDTWSTVTAKLISDHTRSPVYFEEAVKRIEARYGPCTWLEAGSNSSVTNMAQRALSDYQMKKSESNHLFCPVNLSRSDAMGALADTTVNLWKNRHHHVQFWPFHRIQAQDYRTWNAPPYQFEKARHWLEFNLQAGGGSSSSELASSSPPKTIEPEPQLITLSGYQDGEQKVAVFTIDPRSEEWKVLVDGHSVLHQPLCPTTLYLELVQQAVKQLASMEKDMACAPFARVDNLDISTPLGMSQDKVVQLVMRPVAQTGGLKFNFSFHSQTRHNLTDTAKCTNKTNAHAVGMVEMISTHEMTAEMERTAKLLKHGRNNSCSEEFAQVETQAGGEAVHGTLVYKVFSRVVQYRDFYQGVRRVAGNRDGQVRAEVHLPQESQPTCTRGLLSTPVAIDNFFQVPGLYANCLAPCPTDDVWVSTHVDRIQLSPEFGKTSTCPSPGWHVLAISTAISHRESDNDIFVMDQITGQLVFVAYGAKFTRVRTASLAKMLSNANPKDATASRPIIADEVLDKTRTVIRIKSHVVTQPQPQLPLQSPPEPPVRIPSPLHEHSPQAPSFFTQTQTPGVEEVLREMLSKMTDVPAHQFQGHVRIEDLGIDSLMATEIASEIRELFGISIPQQELQALETFASLCKHVDAHESRQGTRKDFHQPQSQPPTAPPVYLLPTDSTSLPTATTSHAQHFTGVQEIPSVAETFKTQSDDQQRQEDLVSRLASLLGSHLDCPARDFEMSTNLVDRGLDSLLCMELMNDIIEIFGVSLDLSDAASNLNFGSLADMLVQAVAPISSRSSTSSTLSTTSVASLLTESSSGLAKPKTIPHADKEILTPTTKTPSTVDILGSAAREFESIKGEFDKFADQYKFSNFYDTVYPSQMRLVLAYAVEAFSDLGIDLNSLAPGDQIPRINVVPKHGRILDFLYEILRHGNLADYDGRGYVRSDVKMDLTHSSALFKDILTQFPQHAKEHTLLNLCGADLSKFLSGKMDPLSVLFGSKTNRDVLEDVYVTAPMFVIMSQLLTDFLDKVLSTSSPGTDGKFHIVELGAGTGATTRWVVDRLVQRGIPFEYTFTDISSALVSTAKRKLAKYSNNMKYATINIEKEPPVQYQGQFDIVLATNCIHATSNLPNSLSNINRLLRPHGFASLVELTTRNFWLDMVFGLLDGWWLFDDGRPYVLATPEFWDKSMRQSGFKHVSWTGGHSRESEVIRVITGFKQPFSGPYESIPQEKEGGVETVVFAHTDKKLPLRADFYYPSKSQASMHTCWVPGLLVHGGGHVMLSRRDLRPRQIQHLLDNGVLPVAVDYRLCPETTILEGPLVDVGTAYAWVRNTLPKLKLTHTNASQLVLDPSRAVAIGWSTGGTLAMSLAWTSAQRGIPPPDAILAFYCPTDYEDEFWRKPNIPHHSDGFVEQYNVVDGVFPAPITAYNVPPGSMAAAGWIAPKDARSRVALHMNWCGQTMPVLFRGLPSASSIAPRDAARFNNMEQPAMDADDVLRASPYAQIIRGNYKSPTHIVFGTGDDLIPWQQAQRTVDAMGDAGIVSSITLAPGQPHLFDMYRDRDGSKWRYVLEGYEFLFRAIARRDIM